MVDSSLRGSCRRMRPVLPSRTRKPSTSSMPRWTEARHGLLPVRGTQRRGRAAQPANPPTRSTRFQSWHSLWAHHLTPCMPCTFAVPRRTRSEPRPQSNGPHRVTVTVRWIPLATAAYGTRVATAAEDDAAPTWRRWLQLGQRARPVPGDRRLVGKSPKGSRQPDRDSSPGPCTACYRYQTSTPPWWEQVPRRCSE
jgi:hypothetical protein